MDLKQMRRRRRARRLQDKMSLLKVGVIRQWLNDNSALAVIVAAVILLIALLVILNTNKNAARPTGSAQWYYDIESRKRFKDEGTKIAPFETASGGTGVSAMVYSCGDCDSDWKIAFLRKYSDEAKKLKEEQRRALREAVESGVPPAPGQMGPLEQEMLISRVDPIEWFEFASPDAEAILAEYAAACGDKAATICRAR